MADLQRADTDLLALIQYLQGDDVIPRPLPQVLTSYCLRRNVLYKKNFENSQETLLLAVPAALREEVLQACHDDPLSTQKRSVLSFFTRTTADAHGISEAESRHRPTFI